MGNSFDFDLEDELKTALEIIASATHFKQADDIKRAIGFLRRHATSSVAGYVTTYCVACKDSRTHIGPFPAGDKSEYRCSQCGHLVLLRNNGSSEKDYDLPNDWEPDFNAESGRERHEREYQEKYSNLR